MSVVELMGYGLSVAEGTLSEELEDASPERRATDGSILSSERWRPRIVSASTAVLPPSEWQAIRGLVLGRGHAWNFETDPGYDGSDPSAGADLYSSRGLATPGTPVASRRGAEPIATAGGTYLGAKRGDACVAIERPTTNILPANVRTGTDAAGDTSGFTRIDSASLSSVTSGVAWQGSRVLRVEIPPNTPSSRGGVYTTGIAAPSTGTYVGSVYVRAASGTPSVLVRLYNETTTQFSETFFVTISSSEWTRIETGPLAANSGEKLRLYVHEGVIDSDIVLFCDGFQIEEVGSSGIATSWVGAGSGATDSRMPGGIEYRLTDFGPADSLTVMAWVRAPAQAAGYLWAFETIDGFIRASFDTPDFNLESADGSGVAGGSAILNTPAEWHHVAWVIDRGAGVVKSFVDGAAEESASATVPAFIGNPRLRVGFYEGDDEFNGLIDDLVVLPYAATDEMIAAWAAYEGSFPRLPELIASGDVFGGGLVPVRGRVGAARQTTAVFGGVVQRRAAALPWILTEARRR